MAKTMILRPILIASFALISLVSLSESDPLTEASITGFTTDLIHRDSPQSPSYDPSLSQSQRVANALKRSFNRVQHLKGRQSGQTPEPGVIPAGGEYLMKYSVGTPPVPTLSVADTGSDIIWTQCQPCTECFNQSLPLFKPKSSRTYRKVSCKSARCSFLPGTAYCSKDKRNCLYRQMYADLSHTSGQVASDTFTLSSAGGKKSVSIPKIVFGCGFDNSGTFSGTESGIVGLGWGKGSFVRQLPTAQGKFSYCLPLLSNHSNSGKLHFGANAKVSGRGAVSTPLIKKDKNTYYSLTLEGISVGKKRLDLYNHSSSRHHPEGNIIIDSGTVLTFLDPDLYYKLKSSLKSSMKLKQINDPQGFLELCFFSRKDDIKIPEITVHFKGADVKWKSENVFIRRGDDALCMAALPFIFPVYGNVAQTNFLVGYDLEKRTLSFKPDCGQS